MIDEKNNPISNFGSLKPKLIDNVTLLNKVNDNLPTYSPSLTPTSSNQSDKKQKLSFWIEGYGCSASFADMEMIAGQLIDNGFEIAGNPNGASINLIVTCSVKETTEHRMVHRIKSLSKNNKPLIVAGCLPSADQKLVQK